ncbi:hypothetical protein ACPB4E_13215, partial [Escherichia coli]
LQGKISSDGCLKKEQMVVSAIASTPQVDICAIRDIVELAGINLWGEAAAAYKWLERLHCVSFSDMSADIALMVPHKINMVFAGGNYTYPWNKEQRENRKAHAMKSNATP